MKEIRIFVASSKELERERNELAFLVLENEEAFAARGVRVRLAKWEYVDPKMTEGRTEDRYLDEMYGCDAAFVLFRDIAGMYTREELDKALAMEREGTMRLKAHAILFAADGKPGSDAARLRESLPEGSYSTWSTPGELREAFLALVERVAECGGLRDAPSEKYVRKITAFLAADEELAEERNAFADTVLNVNELLEQARRNIRVQLRFYDPEQAESVLESSEMGLVLYGTNYRMFGRKEIEDVYVRVKNGNRNPKRFYVFFRDLDETAEKSLDEAFKTFRSDFVTKLGHFTCQFGDANALRLGFLLSLERYAGESVELYSTVGMPTATVFVGREDELRRLRGLLEPVPGIFPAGRLPVVTGAGGTGKSELVRQFASQLRVQYPGGVFQVDMEHRKTWDDAFRGLLDGIPNNGVPVREYLGLEGRSEEKLPTGADVRDALLRKSRSSGPVLLVLDNVEGCEELLGEDGAFLKAFPAGFSERVHVNVVATARTCDVPFRENDWAVPFPLGDLSSDAALELLFADKKAESEMEKKGAERVAELLGRRSLFLRRVPAILRGMNKKAHVVFRTYASLAEALEKDVLGTIGRTGTVAPSYWPARLWKIVQGNLAEWGLGEACIKLVKIASFFSPDGFSKHILRHLWNELVYPGLEDWGDQGEVFDQVVDLAKNYNIFQSDDPVRIHRLDREAILQTAKTEPGLEEALGAVLGTSGLLLKEDWAFLYEHERIHAHLPAVLAEDGRFWLAVLCKHPGLSERCPWEKLDGQDWVRLLHSHPEFAGHCAWEKLDGMDWGGLLFTHPQFADRCAWQKLDGEAWCRLLGGQPQFAERCPWEYLSGEDWSFLLGKQPQFAEHCSWEKLNGRDWGDLIGVQLRFADRCPQEKQDGGYWSGLLAARPWFSDRCPWEKLEGCDWSHLLGAQPQFAGRCPWETLQGWDWCALLRSQPQFAKRCPWAKLPLRLLMPIFLAQPQLAIRFGQERLSAHSWGMLFRKHPRLLEQLDLAKMSGKFWSGLLREQPQLAVRCPWGKLAGADWGDLLWWHPQFEDHCSWNKLDGETWAELLSGRPQFAGHCAWEKLSGADWCYLLQDQPQFADHCAWEKLDSRNWKVLLCAQPQFADRCPADKRPAGMG